jgi:hypothetical protein
MTDSHILAEQALYVRIAEALCWELDDTRGFSLMALRDLVRAVHQANITNMLHDTEKARHARILALSAALLEDLDTAVQQGERK